MLAYAADTRAAGEAPHPKTLLLIIAGHALALAAVMLARSDLPGRMVSPPLIIENSPLPKDPPPNQQDRPRQSTPSHVTAPEQIVNVQPTVRADDWQVAPDSGPVRLEGTGASVTPQPPFQPIFVPHDIVRRAPRLATPGAMLRPPFPDSKRLLGEEAVLTLKLSIDARGRVTAVEPVGSADRTFLESARRHLLRAWRFEPATEDDRPVPSTKVITLHFELGDA